ncbi:MAG TPA: AAA family ATPase [Mycobacteriales bacterium]
MTAVASSDPNTGTGVRLAGRSVEVGGLLEAVRAVAVGRGGCVWIEGEPGIGKSALLDAAATAAADTGCRVLRAGADELAQRFPLRAVIDCLQVSPASRDPDRREIAALLRGGGRDAARPTDVVPAAAERLLALVDRLCASAPTVLVLDDVQWADEASLQLWQRLGRSAAQLPLMLVTACRPVPRRAEIVALRRGLAAAGAQVWSLEPLTPAAVTDLSAQLLGADRLGGELRALLDRAAGNPLYLREMVDSLVREGWLRHRGGTVELADEGREAHTVPTSLAAAVAERLGFVPDSTLAVARAAALLGTTFTITDLSAVLDRSAADLGPAVSDAVAAGLLVESGVRLAFRHGLIRQALHDNTPAALRLALHAQAGRALARAGAPVERVAEQLLAALPRNDAEQAIDDWMVSWLLGPGRALTYRTPEIAAELFTRAVEHLPGDDPRRPDLQVLLAPVLLLIGRPAEAGRMADRVRQETADPGRAALMAFTLGEALAAQQRTEDAATAMGAALRDGPPDPVWTARLRAQLGRVLVVSGEDERGWATAAEALAEARAAGDGVAEATALIVRGAVEIRRGDPAAAASAYGRGLAVLDDHPANAELRLLLLHNQANALSGLDRVEQADAAIREMLALAERVSSPQRQATKRLLVAELAFGRGRWDDALAELETAADLRDRMTLRYRQWLHGLRALIAVHRDDLATADAQLAQTEPTTTGLPEALIGVESLLLARSVLAERRGGKAAALAELAGALPYAAHLSERSGWLPDLVRLAVDLDERQLAGEAAAVVAKDADDHPAPRQAAADLRVRGLLHGDPEELIAAADLYRPISRPHALAATLEDAAVAYARLRRPLAARTPYAEAGAIYTELGATWDLLRADSRLRPLGLRRPRRSRRTVTTGWGALTPTELAVARLVAAGHPNPEIAGHLFLSRRTVEVHVSHILAKLGVRSRIEIARHAADNPE